MVWIPFELLYLHCLFVDVGDEPTGGFAVEAGGRHEHVALLDLLGPGGGVVLDPIVPLIDGREGFERCNGEVGRH